MRKIVAVVVVCFAAGCSSADDREATVADLRVSYEDIAPPGVIDQTVTFQNDASVALIPNVAYRALGASGTEVPGIEVSTAFGSDRSLLVVPPDGYFDVLTFTGDRVREVVDVDIEILGVEQVAGYLLEESLEPEPLDADLAPVSKFDQFTYVALTNPTDETIALRVVCVRYDSPEPGNAQQAIEVHVVADHMTVPPGDRVVSPVDPSFTARTAELGYGCDSLKAHPTPRSAI